MKLDLVATHRLFPTFVWKYRLVEHEATNARFRSFLEQLRESDQEGVQISNRGGWQSEARLQDEPLFAEFVAAVTAMVREDIDRNGYGFDVPGQELGLVKLWGNINPPGSYNAQHAHWRSVVSAAYYIHVPEGSGALRFFDPTARLRMHEPRPRPDRVNVINRHGQRFVVRAGDLLLFPAWLEHEVGRNSSSEDRIGLGMNFDLRPVGSRAGS